MAKKEEEFSQSIQDSLLQILEEIEKEDEDVRHKMLRECKQNELYWHGFQEIFWNESTQEFRIPSQDVIDSVGRENINYIYNYIVNTFKSHGLSIIAALSAEIPAVAFSPMDANSASDTLAARKAESLGKIIQKYNKSKLLFYHALFILYTNHFVAAYNYYERNEELGTVEIPKFEKRKQKLTADTYSCPNDNCDYKDQEEGEFDQHICPHCEGELDKTEGEIESIPVKVGTEEVDRGMEIIKVKGALNVKIPIYAENQAACGYLIDYSDQHFAWIRNKYKDIDRDKLGATVTDSYEKMMRMPSFSGSFHGSYTNNLVTLKRVWLRPWMYDILDKEKADELHKEFPKGVYFAGVDSSKMLFAEARKELLDDHWNISKGDLSRSVCADPLGKPLIPLQDLENMVTNLLVESLEHSVPSTWADPEIVDFASYSEQEVAPGMLYPAKNSMTNPTRRMDDYFYSLKTSTLPKEGIDFNRIVETKGQFVVGAFPSIFGGPQTQGSKTLGEYQESRGYALQRLSIPYQLLFFWWSDIIYGSVKDHIKNMISDEKHTVTVQNNKFESIEVLQDTFVLGKFSLLIPEAAVDLPISFTQKRTTMQQMIQLNSDILNEFLFSPENRQVTLKFLGMEELSDVDSNQATKQLLEIEELLSNEPIESPPPLPIPGQIPDQMNQMNQMEQMGQKLSSVPIEPEIDDDEIHLRVIKTFASSPSGQEHKKNNPDGYENMLLHGAEHKANLEQQMMQKMMQESAAKAPPIAPTANNKPVNKLVDEAEVAPVGQ